MGKITAIENVSVDGVMESPETWAFQYHGDDLNKQNQEGMGETSAMLFGRHTYEEFAVAWGQHHGPDEIGIAAYLNSVKKYVVSTTLQSADWQNTTLIGSNVYDELRKLKQELDGDIGIVGSATLVRSLLNEKLLDRLTLFVHPLVLGKGERMFTTQSDMRELKLVESRAFSKGVVMLVYEPA